MTTKVMAVVMFVWFISLIQSDVIITFWFKCSYILAHLLDNIFYKRNSIDMIIDIFITCNPWPSISIDESC